MNQAKKRRNIVARVMAAENKSEAVAAEAKRAGVSTRTVERWVEAAKAAPSVGQPVVSGDVPPVEKPAENPVLDKLMEGEGSTGKPAEGPITQGEVLQAAADAERFCVEAYGGIRSAVGSVLVSMRYTPPLDATSPEVLRLLQMSKAAELAIKANAPRLYPILTRYASNWGALLLAIGADALGMIMGLEALAKSQGWTHAPKRAAERPSPAQVPTPQQYGEQLRTGQENAGAPDEKKATVIDAPLPTEEQLAAASAVRQVLTN